MASPSRALLGLLPLMVSVPVAALALGSFQGCTVLTNDAPPDEAGVYDGGEAGPDASLDCNECVISACEGEWSTCLASSDCVSVLACASAPGCDASCQAACACASPAGAALLNVAERCDRPQRCGGGACQSACSTAGLSASCTATTPTCGSSGTDGGTDAGSTDSGSVDAGATDAAATDDGGDASADAAAPVTAASCNGCIASACNDQRQQCPSGSDCDAYLTCAINCTTAACVSDCGSNHATGKQASLQLAMCVNVSCKPDCGL